MNRRLLLAALMSMIMAASCGFDERDDDDLMVVEEMDGPSVAPSWVGVERDVEMSVPMDSMSPFEPSQEEQQSEEEPEEPAAEEEALESEEEPESEELDLSCADDPSICRFCGPPQDVVESCPAGDPSFECRVFEKVNQIRVDAGLNAVDYHADLAWSAMVHAMDLSLCDYFSHDSLDGTSFFDRCHDGPFEGTCSGENIGGGQSSPQAVIDAWMDSPGHRDNILYPHHEYLGVAYFEGDGNFSRYWLKHFGR